MGSLIGLYIERFGETEIYHADAIRTNYGAAPADTYFDLPKMLELVTDLRGDV